MRERNAEGDARAHTHTHARTPHSGTHMHAPGRTPTRTRTHGTSALLIIQIIILGCPADFAFLPEANKCYRLVTDKLSWEGARERCKSLHSKSHLVVVNDQQEQDAITGFLKFQNGINFYFSITDCSSLINHFFEFCYRVLV